MKTRLSNQIFEILGWIGVVLVLGSYLLLATGVIHSNALIYHALVLAGSLFIVVISYIKRAYQPMALNICFVLFAIIALLRLGLQ